LHVSTGAHLHEIFSGGVKTDALAAKIRTIWVRRLPAIKQI
jgi:hypothetical protein